MFTINMKHIKDLLTKVRKTNQVTIDNFENTEDVSHKMECKSRKNLLIH